MGSRIKFAIIGCGHIGKRHAKMVIENSACELIALCDIANKKNLNLEGLSDYPLFNSIEELINSNLQFDVACVCTPNGLHAEQSIKLLKNKKHVVCEKPLGLTSKQCKAIISTSKEVGKKVFCVMQNRYSPPSAWLKEITSNDILGEIYMVQVNCFWNRDDRYYGNSNWRGTEELDGGTLFTQFSHFIDTLYWTLGEIKINSAVFKDFNHQNSTTFEDSGVVNFEFRKGGLGVLNYSTSVWNENLESSITIIAEKGSVKIGGQYMDKVDICNVEKYKMPKLAPINEPNDYGSYKGSAANHQYVIQNVVDTLNGNKEVATNVFEGFKVVEIIEKIYKLKSSI